MNQPSLHFEGVPVPVRPGAALLGQTRRQIGRYVDDPVNGVVHIDNSVYFNNVAYALQEGRKTGYTPLIEHPKNRALIDSKKVDEGAMKGLFENMYKSMWQNHVFWAEVVDVSPEMRGVALPEGKNTVLYRGARLVDNGIDVTGAEKVFLSMPKREDKITPEWATALGVKDPEIVHYPVDRDRSIRNLNGLTGLVWGLWDRGGPCLGSYGGLGNGYSEWGALLGRAPNREAVYRVQLTRMIEESDDPLAEAEAIISAAQGIKAGMEQA